MNQRQNNFKAETTSQGQSLKDNFQPIFEAVAEQLGSLQIDQFKPYRRSYHPFEQEKTPHTRRPGKSRELFGYTDPYRENWPGRLSTQTIKYGEAAPFDPATLPICYSHTPPQLMEWFLLATPGMSDQRTQDRHTDEAAWLSEMIPKIFGRNVKSYELRQA